MQVPKVVKTIEGELMHLVQKEELAQVSQLVI